MAVLLAVCALLGGDDTKIADDLRSLDREVRYDAIKAVSQLDTIPPTVATAMFDALRLEAAFLAEPAEKPRVAADKLPPLTGDEVSLVRVKANPAQYVGKRFIIVGIAQISDYWNYGYSDAEHSHYSISFTELRSKPDGGLSYGKSSLFICLSDLGSGFADQLAKNAENGYQHTAVRATVTISPDRNRGEETWDLLELIDVQQMTADRNSWGVPVLPAWNY